MLIDDPQLGQLLSLNSTIRLTHWRRNIVCSDRWCGPQWEPDETVESDVARYWMTPPTKRGRHRHVSAPVAVFARKVLALLQGRLPMCKWSLTRYDNLTPGLEEFDGLKVCQEFASITELREWALDLLLGRSTNTRHAHPVFCELLYLPPFACFQPRPQVNLKLARWLQRESKFWQWQCEAAIEFGFVRVPTAHDFRIETWVRRRISDPEWRDRRLQAPPDHP